MFDAAQRFTILKVSGNSFLLANQLILTFSGFLSAIWLLRHAMQVQQSCNWILNEFH